MRGLGTGELKHPRFTKEEAAASGEVVHERLWNFILSLESPEVYFGGGEEGSSRDGADDPKSGGWLGCFRRMATRYGSDPRGLIDSSFKFLDKGAESHVYVGEHLDKVLKVRKFSFYSLDGVKSELAKLVYHNTFIDATTGEVRFIDPRVDINDPGAGFSVSKFGKRKIDNSPMVSFDTRNVYDATCVE